MSTTTVKTISIEEVINLIKDYGINNIFNTAEGVYVGDRLIDNPLKIDNRDLYAYLTIYYNREYIETSYNLIKKVEDKLASKDNKPSTEIILAYALDRYFELNTDNKNKLLQSIDIYDIFNIESKTILINLITKYNKIESFKVAILKSEGIY